MQSPSSVFLVKPSHFGFNAETAASNSFQYKADLNPLEIQRLALAEFDNLLHTLDVHKISFDVFDSPEGTPDAVFPNNWISTHSDGTLVLYPMMAPNRRIERNPAVIDFLRTHYRVNRVIDLSASETEGVFLEGTGSIVFDHLSRTAFACISPRTDARLFEQLCHTLHYTPFSFEASDRQGKPVYHTNVLLHIGEKYAAWCGECVDNILERNLLREKLQQIRNSTLELRFDQVLDFAGNMLEVLNRSGERCLLMSERAFSSLDAAQLSQLEKTLIPVQASIPTIERYGGGSIRCMLAGNYLEKIP